MRMTTLMAVALLATAAVGCGPNTADPAAAPSGGSMAQDFTLPTVSGTDVSLRDYRGKKVVLIDFWATTCDPCLTEMPELVKIYKARKDKGFELLAISTDGPDTVSAVSTVAKDKGMVFPILLDEETEVMDQYNPKGTLPYAVLVSRDGRILLERASYQAGDEAATKSLEAAIDKALAEK